MFLMFLKPLQVHLQVYQETFKRQCASNQSMLSTSGGMSLIGWKSHASSEDDPLYKGLKFPSVDGVK